MPLSTGLIIVVILILTVLLLRGGLCNGILTLLAVGGLGVLLYNANMLPVNITVERN